MAATLSVQDYLNHFLFNRDHELAGQNRKRIASSSNHSKPSSPVRKFSDAHLPAPTKVITTSQQNFGLMLAHVYQIISGGKEKLLYSKRIEGHKSIDLFGIFVQDMIGSKGWKATQIQDGRMSRGSSLSDVSSISVMEVEDGHLQPNTTVSVQLISSRSPSNIGSAELLGLLDHCKRSKIRISVQLKFAHAYTWDNKYNREGLESLHTKGVKLSSLNFPQMLSHVFDDIKEDLFSFDQLQTCRGTISIEHDLIDKSMSTLRQDITIRSDFYHQDQEEQLAEIIGQINNIPQYKKFTPSELPAVLSLETYRECILLQNVDTEWGKIKVNVTKVAKGVTKEDTAFEKVLTSPEKVGWKHQKNPSKRKDLDMDLVWEKVGSKVTMGDLSECDRVILTVNALVSEYNGHVGWVEEITQLHNFLRDKAEESEVYKVRVETTIRYAHSIDGPVPMSAKSKSSRHGISNGITNGIDQLTLGFPRGMKVECLHIQDILFEMLEDLEDNIRHLGGLDYGRGANLCVEKEGLARAMGLLNKAIKIRTGQGKFSMNDEFVDEYAKDMNGV